MKALLFLIGCGGIIVGVLYTMEFLPAMSRGEFGFEQYRTQSLIAATGGVVGLLCFSKAFSGGKKTEMDA